MKTHEIASAFVTAACNISCGDDGLPNDPEQAWEVRRAHKYAQRLIFEGDRAITALTADPWAGADVLNAAGVFYRLFASVADDRYVAAPGAGQAWLAAREKLSGVLPPQCRPPEHGPRFTEVPDAPDPADAYADDWSDPPAVDYADWRAHRTG
jgi:hypothetical protein